MTWFRLDDSGWCHPKVLAVGNRAFGAWCRAGQWSASQLSDGVVPLSIARVIDADSRSWKCLVRVGLLHEVEGGYLIHDYLRYNPSREQVEAKRQTQSAGGRVGANARWHGSTHRSTHDSTHSATHDDLNGPVPSRPDPDLNSASVAPVDPTTLSATALHECHAAPGEAGEPKAKRKRTTKPKAEPQAEPEGYRAVVDAYFTAFAAARGGEKPLFGPRDGKSTKRLIEAAGSWERACEVIASAYADPWLSQRVSINDLAADPSKFVGRAATLQPRRDVQRSPPGHLDRVLAEQRAEGQRRAALAPADCFALTAEELQS